MSEHVEWRPHPSLARWVRSMHGYRINGAEPGVHFGLPSSTLTLIVAFDDPLLVTLAGEQTPTAYESMVAGLHTRAALIHHDGNQAGIQIALEPDGARALLGIPAADIVDAGATLNELLGLRPSELDVVRDQPDWPARFRALERVLRVRFDGDRGGHPAADAWALIATRGGAVRIADLAEDLGYSPRRVQQLFRAEYGVHAKTAASLRRFERAHRMIGRGVPLIDTAHRCGYADQSHLTREWRRFTGVSPTTWLRKDTLRYTA